MFKLRSAPIITVFTRPHARKLVPTTLRVANLSQSQNATPQSRATEQRTAQLIGKRVLRYTVFALVSIAAVYEGAHFYVEHVQMKPETDSEVRKWEWDLINNEWTGDVTKGGTSPSLGFRARHVIRAAFAAYNRDGPDATVMVDETNSNESSKGHNIVDARLYETERHLKHAISLVEEKLSRNGTQSHAFFILLLRHADMLEQLGHGEHLRLAKEDYERAWQHCKAEAPHYQEFVAWKLGDLCSRLGNSNEAMLWWKISTQLVQGSDQDHVDVSNRNSSNSHSPLAQRILSSILVSKSAHLASSGNFEEAQALEETALNFLRSIRHPDSISAASPPQALHALYLLQRSSLLSVHQAEVLHAQHRPIDASIQWLASAADSSERVVQILTGAKPDLPSSKSDRFEPSTSSKNITEVLPVYTLSPSLNAAARSLLRDARRTVAEAWNMMGILYEHKYGAGSHLSLECFERALSWASTVRPSDKSTGPAKDILHSDWHIYWSNYQRAKNAPSKRNQK